MRHAKPFASILVHLVVYLDEFGLFPMGQCGAVMARSAINHIRRG